MLPTVPGTISQTILELAREFKLAILAGLLEKDSKGRVYASHLVVTPRGVAGIYRKIHIAPPETDVFSAGDTIRGLSWVSSYVMMCTSPSSQPAWPPMAPM
jgi:predicted amidohydrolase